jgi:ABC-type cobalamin/Fe3+-siderophores transport system ATPase subunit
MSFCCTIPSIESRDPIQLILNKGEMLFVLGANGTGKSSVIQTIRSQFSGNTRRILAHRQNWLRSGMPELTGLQRNEYEQHVRTHDHSIDARWKDDFQSQRSAIAMYDLLSLENHRARQLADACERGDAHECDRLKRGTKGAIATVNRIMRLAGMDVAISIQRGEELTATKRGGPPYSIAKLSDGERNAILIAANVLTALEESLIIIDEPERHLHRSIVSPLISQLLQERPDCTFVVSTHEPQLPIDNPMAHVLLTRACEYSSGGDVSYDADLIVSADGIDDELKRAILGERRKVVFVEGSDASLDKPLYTVLFPNASIVARQSCREVVSAVKGIAATVSLNWVCAFGLVDGDASDVGHIEDLRAKGVAVLDWYSVEALYYHPDTQRMIASKYPELASGSVEDRLDRAKGDALKAIREKADSLSEKLAKKAIREMVLSSLPGGDSFVGSEPVTITFNYQSIVLKERTKLDSLVEAGDFLGVLRRYSIKESNAPDRIAKALGFQSRLQYQSVVVAALMKDQGCVEHLRGLLGALPNALIEQV